LWLRYNGLDVTFMYSQNAAGRKFDKTVITIKARIALDDGELARIEILEKIWSLGFIQYPRTEGNLGA